MVEEKNIPRISIAQGVARIAKPQILWDQVEIDEEDLPMSMFLAPIVDPRRSSIV